MHSSSRQAASFAQQLGCDMLPDGAVKVDEIQQATVPGVSPPGILPGANP
ncbi:hypothetical protein [Lentzea albidocapillata]|nr:hypothetical protein [Lentzea albidocapillata]